MLDQMLEEAFVFCSSISLPYLPTTISDLTRSLVQTLPTPYAVLDLHFSPNKPDILGVAASTGKISLFKVDHEVPKFVEFSVVQVAESSILVLSLAWCPSPNEVRWVAASLSDGNIVVFDSEDSQCVKFQSQCHNLEVWTLAWLPGLHKNNQFLFSGGDDSVIRANGVEWRQEGLSSPTRLYGSINRDLFPPDRKIHGAGITAILPLVATARPEKQIVVTGSYDEYMRVLAAPKSSQSSRWDVLVEKRLYGGVWRLKLIRSQFRQGSNIFTILASCMHAGVRILTVSKSADTEWTLETTARFEEHESMNYASEARIEPGEGDLKEFTVVSTSFYDRKLCVWKHDGF